MKTTAGYGLLFGAYLCVQAAFAGDDRADFSPCPGTTISAKASREELEYWISANKTTQRATVHLGIESTPHIAIDDFNFDGKSDLSVWYLDEGMRVYTLHRIFLFDASSSTLKEVASSCGDDFINLRTEKDKRRLLVTVFRGGQPELCETKLMPLVDSVAR